MKSLIVTTLLLLLSSAAFADQCAYITKTQAEKAVKVLIETQTVQSLCEPCGESKALTVQVNSIGLRKAGYQSYSEVVINDKGIDLAYTYINGLNLAKLVGCPTQGVSFSLK